jgi:hypothetical protein
MNLNARFIGRILQKNAIGYQGVAESYPAGKEIPEPKILLVCGVKPDLEIDDDIVIDFATGKIIEVLKTNKTKRAPWWIVFARWLLSR